MKRPLAGLSVLAPSLLGFRYVALVALIPLLALPTGCTASAPKSAPGSAGSCKSAVAIEPAAQVAAIDGQTITYAEIDKEVGGKVRQAESDYLTKVYEIRREALEGMLMKRLLEGEAKKSNQTGEEFVRDYFSKTAAPPDAELQAFYDQNAQQMGGRSFGEMKERLTGFLKQQKAKEGLTKLLDGLKEVHGVKVSLAEPDLPRVAVEAKGPSRGPDGAKVTIVEFSDFQCPYCSKVGPTIEKVMKEYDGKVRLVFRHFPLEFHPLAGKAAEAGACAADQGKFWQLHDRMFGDQQKLEVGELKKSARELGLDGDKFDKCLDVGDKKALVDADQKAGADAGVQGTPAFFVNGVFISGAQPFEKFKDAIDRELTKG